MRCIARTKGSRLKERCKNEGKAWWYPFCNHKSRYGKRVHSLRSHPLALLGYGPFWGGVAVLIGVLAQLMSIASSLRNLANAEAKIRMASEEQLLELQDRWTVGSILPLGRDAVDALVGDATTLPAVVSSELGDTLPERLRRSLDASARGRFAVALALLPDDALVEQDGISNTERKLIALAYQARGRSLAGLKRWGEALASLEKSRSQDSMQTNLEIAIAVCLRNLGRHQTGKENLDRVVSRHESSNTHRGKIWDRGFYGALFERAVAQRLLGFPDRAVADFDRAINLLLQRTDAVDRQSDAMRLAYALSNRGNAHADAGELRAALRDSAAAVESYRSAFRDRRDDPERWRMASLLSNNGAAYSAVENWTSANALFQHATQELDAAKEQRPDAYYWLLGVVIRLNRVESLQNLQRREDALRVADEGIGILNGYESRTTTIKTLRWRLLSEMHRVRAACAKTPDAREESLASSVQLAKRAQAMSPDLENMLTLAQSLTDRGNAFLRREDTKSALTDFEAGIAGLEPLAAQVRSSKVNQVLAKLFARRGETQRRRGNNNLAIKDIERAITIRERKLSFAFTASLAAKNAALRNTIGALLFQEHNYTEAEKAFAAAASDYIRALEVSDSNEHRYLLALVHQHRSTALAHARQRDAALATLQQGIDLMETLFVEQTSPKHGEALFLQLGQRAFAMTAHDRSAAINSAKRAMEVDASVDLPDTSNVRTVRAACQSIIAR